MFDPMEEQALQYRAEKEAWDACQRAKKQHWASLPESKQASILKLKEIMETHRAPKLKHRPRKAVNHKREGKCAKAAIREYIGWVKAHPGALNDELVFVGELVHTENGDDVLQVLVLLKDLLHLTRDGVVLVTHNTGLEDPARRVEGVDGRVDALGRD